MEIVISIIALALELLSWLIIIRVLLSWLPMLGIQIDPYNPAVRFLTDVTDPILEPIRRFTTVGMIDLSPIVAIIGIQLIVSILYNSI
jgi:YggT family protein